MIFDIIQTKSGKYDAEFEIKDKNCEPLGSISFKGGDLKKGTFTIHFKDKTYHMSETVMEKNDEVVLFPYTILADDKETATLYQTELVEEQATFYKLHTDNHVYSLYSTHFGKRDTALNLYDEEKQIAQLEFDYEVDGENKYTYHVYGVDQDDVAISSIFFCMYYYILHDYLPGDEAPRIRNYSNKVNEWLYSKYNPHFISHITQGTR
jgi:hypothetical protein